MTCWRWKIPCTKKCTRDGTCKRPIGVNDRPSTVSRTLDLVAWSVRVASGQLRRSLPSASQRVQGERAPRDDEHATKAKAPKNKNQRPRPRKPKMSVFFGDSHGFKRLSELGCDQLQPREVILVLETKCECQWFHAP